MKELNENVNTISPCNTKIECDIDEGDLLLDCIELLRKKKGEYIPDAEAVLEKQSEITPLMRAVLLDWMMEVCFELKLRKDVFHYAVNYVDRYLVVIPSVPMKRLQLVGMVALLVACKIEEVAVPKISEFISTALGQYSLSEVQHEEQALLGALQWRLVPPTLYAWAALSLPQWDKFISRSESLFVKSNLQNLLFKSPTKESYKLFQEMLQLLDATLLVLETLQYDQRALVVSALYFILILRLDPSSLVFPPFTI